MTNIFAKAKADAKPAAKKKAGKERMVVTLEGLETLAAIKSVMAMLEGMQETFEAQVKDQVADIFVTEGAKLKKRPDNFDGEEGMASTSAQIRKRSTRSVLDDDTADMLEKLGLEVETINDVNETFVINPDYAQDEAMLAKVSEALVGVKGLPDDFIIAQEGKTRRVVGEKALDQVFTLPKKKIAEILPIVSTLALRTKTDGDITKSMAILTAIMAGDDE